MPLRINPGRSCKLSMQPPLILDLMPPFQVPEPSARYRRIQANIQKQERGYSQYQKAARRLFCQTFHLREIGPHTRLCEALKEIVPDLIDHAVEFKHDIVFPLVVSQPYGSKECYVEEFAFLKTLHIEVVDLDRWAWHYPGHASCYGLV